MTPSDPTPLTAEELDELERLARAATPETKGRWRYRVSDLDRAYAYVEWGEKDAGYGTALLSKPMARYIAALSPDVVLRLLATLDARELDVERLSKVFADHEAMGCCDSKTIDHLWQSLRRPLGDEP